MQYHAPEIGCYLDKVGVTPELYAIPWFVAYLATKISNLDLLLEFWDHIVKRNEPSYIYFFLVSFVICNKKKIKSVEVAKLPETMTGLKITNIKELYQIFDKAEMRKQHTPLSFNALPEIQAIFTKNHPDLKIVC